MLKFQRKEKGFNLLPTHPSHGCYLYDKTADQENRFFFLSNFYFRFFQQNILASRRSNNVAKSSHFLSPFLELEEIVSF